MATRTVVTRKHAYQANMPKVLVRDVPMRRLATFREQVKKEVHEELREIENIRANHRNRNRAIMLAVAMVSPLFMNTALIMLGFGGLLRELPALAITLGLLPDAALTVYAWWRKY